MDVARFSTPVGLATRKTRRAAALLTFVAAFAASTTSPPAYANGRFPAANQLVLDPSAPSHLVLRATFGLLVSSDSGKSWDWICERAIGYGGVYDPPIAIVEGGRVLAGTIDGLAIGSEGGCRWSLDASLGKRAVIDVTVRSGVPREAYALVTKNVGATDAGAALYETAVWKSADAAATWTKLAGSFPPAFIAQTLEIAPADPSRLYVSGSGDGQGALYVSDDGGATYAERLVPLEKPAETSAFIAAVDPTDKNRLYIRTSGPVGRLLVSDDGGQSFRAVHRGAPLAGFALANDGARVFVGSADGVFVAERGPLTFKKVNTTPVQCLYSAGNSLYACGAIGGAFALAVSQNDGERFTSLFELSSVRGPLACGAGTETASCAADWPAVKAVLAPAAAETPGTISSPDAGALAPGRYGLQGGCAVASGPAAVGGAALASAVGLLAARRRRRR